MNELQKGEYEMVHIGSHTITVSNKDGTPVINVRDHADFAIEGEHKSDVNVVYTSGEFGSTFEYTTERKFWEDYQK